MRSGGISEPCRFSGPVRFPASAQPNSCSVKRLRLFDCCSRTPTKVKSFTIGACCHLPKRQSFAASSSLSTFWKSKTTSPAQVERRSLAQATEETVLQLAGSDRPTSASRVGQKVRGAGGQLVPVKFAVAFALRLLRFVTDGEKAAQVPVGFTEYEPGGTEKL